MDDDDKPDMDNPVEVIEYAIRMLDDVFDKCKQDGTGKDLWDDVMMQLPDCGVDDRRYNLILAYIKRGLTNDVTAKVKWRSGNRFADAYFE